MAGMRPAWVDDTLFPFTSRFLEIDGNTVHYVDEGRGPILLMLHGNPTWSFVYRDVISQLSATFRCIALDYPGFGLSSPAPGYRFHPADHARVVGEFVDRLDLRDVTLVVQDWGGPIGLTAAVARRERFSALVVGNTWAWPVNGDLHFEMFSRFMGGPIGRLLIRRFNFFVNAMIPAGHRRRRPTAAEMDHYRQALPTPQRRMPSAIFPKDILAAQAFLADLEHGLPTLADLPTLIVWGDADIAFRDNERRRWEALLPRHHTVVLSGAGHYLQSDAPTEFADAIAAWHNQH
ncbi:haloalkane dehalogenase [Mycobacterium cookii]|uniref:Haloalkane dehalogenase 2 n=1 Tax=Mycobacterium cookii TaxID=1775 RepID=A0A7I7KY38_9MYCO|nr:alpha/beta fold hydrolase [Mycobacterium cookii]MCV7331580.1 alpha/beta fold hydrolase [Mycobacterium cookii]BBX46873.1 haloalkane dehalogenase 2 [Mycobacterium cookii]